MKTKKQKYIGIIDTLGLDCAHADSPAMQQFMNIRTMVNNNRDGKIWSAYLSKEELDFAFDLPPKAGATFILQRV